MPSSWPLSKCKIFACCFDVDTYDDILYRKITPILFYTLSTTMQARFFQNFWMQIVNFLLHRLHDKF